MGNKLAPSNEVMDMQGADHGAQAKPSNEFDDFVDRLRFLYNLLVSPYARLDGQCEAYLQAGCKMLGTQYGGLAQIVGSRVLYYVYEDDSDSFIQMEEPLDSVSFFHDAEALGQTYSASSTSLNSVKGANLTYNGRHITSYVGTAVDVSNIKFGVLCFFSTTVENSAFALHDVETVERMAEGVARMIELQTAQNKDRSIELGGFATPGVKTLEEYVHQARLPEVYGIPGRVVEVLQRRIGHAPLAIDYIAEELNLSKRTLQRRLQQQHINFAQLRDQVRFHFSIGYLTEQSTSIDAISASLDFSDRTSFTNAFKRWTGLSPSTFRKLFRDYN